MIQPYYSHAGITIYHARYADVWPLLADASVNLLLADPNYGTTNLPWDVPWDWPAFWPEANRVCTLPALQVLFSQQPFTTDLISSNRDQWRYEIVWKKTMPVGFLDANRRPLRLHETVQLFCRAFGDSTYNPQMTPCKPEREHRAHMGLTTEHWSHTTQRTYAGDVTTERYPVDVLEFSNGHGGKSDHHTAKPLKLLSWLIASYSRPGDLIFDPGMGRGTALWAAKQLGRRAVGCDMREECCERAARGLLQEVLPLAV